MPSKQEILERLKSARPELDSRYPLASLALFGSVSRGDDHNTSDVDILVEFSDKVGLKFFEFANDLERLLGTKVDLVSKKGIKKKYFKQIEPDLIYV
jgi:predicted nucleotidyltransferase